MNPTLVFLTLVALAVFAVTFAHVVVSLVRGGAQPCEARVEAVRNVLQLSGFAALGLGAVSLFDGLFSGTLHPAEIAARLPHYRDTAIDALTAALKVGVVVVPLMVAGVLFARQGRVWVAKWWRYRRRWARVLSDHGLVETDRKRRRVPVLRGMATEPGADVLTVTMLAKQTPEDWHHRSPALAAAFGATAGHIRLGTDLSDIALVLSRPGPSGGTPWQRRRTAELPAARPVPALGAPGRQLVAVRAWSLQIAWARFAAPGNNERTRWGSQRVRWWVRCISFRAAVTV